MILSEKEKLVIFRLCLLTGIITTNDIEQWAIKTFHSSETTRIDYILELCSADRIGINETLTILKENEVLVNKIVIKKLIYGIAGYLFRKNKISIKKMGQIIDRSALEINTEVILEVDLDSCIDDMIYFASQGVYGDLNNVINEVLTATQPYELEGEEFHRQHFIQ